MNKRGIELSFSMLFSILIIAAILATAVYVIIHFVRLGACSEAALFMQNLQEKIEYGWNADEVRDVFSGRVPTSVEKVCFGSLAGARARVEYAELSRFRDEDANVFFYPPLERCSVRYGKVSKATIQGFFCVPVQEGKISITLEKSSSDASVFLCSSNATRCSPTLVR